MGTLFCDWAPEPGVIYAVSQDRDKYQSPITITKYKDKEEIGSVKIDRSVVYMILGAVEELYNHPDR